ncbi:MAG TPA: hypothetical protein VF707_08310 [Ardenticatenaceae bacterium]|jgi:hypothetical protein
MIKTLEGLWDGTTIHPDEPLDVEPNTRVRFTLETGASLPAKDPSVSFLRAARSLKLEGPPDWATNIEEYLDNDALDNHDE